MRVRVLRPFWSNRVVQAKGTVLDLVDSAAYEVVANGKAERLDEEPAKPGKPFTTFTTESAPELVPGKVRKAKGEEHV